jgi:hypothetical protein
MTSVFLRKVLSTERRIENADVLKMLSNCAVFYRKNTLSPNVGFASWSQEFYPVVPTNLPKVSGIYHGPTEKNDRDPAGNFC